MLYLLIIPILITTPVLYCLARISSSGHNKQIEDREQLTYLSTLLKKYNK